MDKQATTETRWQDGEFLRAVEHFTQNGCPTPLVREIGAQILHDRTQDIRTMSGRLLHRTGVRLGFIKIDNQELLEVGTRLQAAGHLRVELEASLLARLNGRTEEHFVRLSNDAENSLA